MDKLANKCPHNYMNIYAINDHDKYGRQIPQVILFHNIFFYFLRVNARVLIFINYSPLYYYFYMAGAR